MTEKNQQTETNLYDFVTRLYEYFNLTQEIIHNSNDITLADIDATRLRREKLENILRKLLKTN